MFSIDCAPVSDFEDFAEIREAIIRTGVPVSSDAPDERPSFQFDYREVGRDALRTILGYADIALTNTPLGIPGACDVLHKDREWVVYPLDGLRGHLLRVTPEAVRMYRDHGTLDAALQVREDLSPGDQLALALLESLDFCASRKLILAVAW